MCIAAVYFHEFDPYPLVVAANRDEYFDRPSAPPGMLVTNPIIIGGKDLLAGGTWLGVNEHGLAAGILNRRVEEKHMPSGARSRGLLCLDILRLKEPSQVCAFLENKSASRYRPFNLFFANAKEAYVAYDHGEEIACLRLEKGLHLLSNTSVYGPLSEKMNHAFPLFSSVADRLEPEKGHSAWIKTFKGILGDHGPAAHSNDPKDALCVHTSTYGTVSSSIIFYSRTEKSFHHYYAPAAPCRALYEGPFRTEVL
jgi:uncharacterized protein with NRDE domain